MRKLIATLILIATAFAVTGSVSASATTWQIVQKAGDVSVTTGGFFPVAIDPRAALPEGAIITTGASGRAILRRGAEQIAVDPSSRLVIAADSSLATRISQEAGSAVFSIGKRRAPHFEVGTPFLAAIVKGTAFRVTVAHDGAAVQVTEGAVEVATRFRSAVTLARPGMTAVVTTGAKAEIQMMENNRRTRTVTKDEGGWSPSAPPANLDGGHSDPGSFSNDGTGASAEVAGGTALLRASTNADIASTDVAPATQPRRVALTTKSEPAAKLPAQSTATLFPAAAPKATTAPRRSTRTRHTRANDELPLREIGIGLLVLMLIMFANHSRGVKRRTEPVPIRLH